MQRWRGPQHARLPWSLRVCMLSGWWPHQNSCGAVPGGSTGTPRMERAEALGLRLAAGCWHMQQWLLLPLTQCRNSTHLVVGSAGGQCAGGCTARPHDLDRSCCCAGGVSLGAGASARLSTGSCSPVGVTSSTAAHGGQRSTLYELCWSRRFMTFTAVRVFCPWKQRSVSKRMCWFVVWAPTACWGWIRLLRHPS